MRDIGEDIPDIWQRCSRFGVTGRRSNLAPRPSCLTSPGELTAAGAGMSFTWGLGALGKDVFVCPDLVVDQRQASGELIDLSGDTLPVLAQEREPLFLVADSLPEEVGVSTDRDHGHAGGAENDGDVQPFHVILAVDATPTGTASYGIGEDAFAFVEAQRVNTQTRALSDLSDTQSRCDLRHAAQNTGLDLESALDFRVLRMTDSPVTLITGGGGGMGRQRHGSCWTEDNG